MKKPSTSDRSNDLEITFEGRGGHGSAPDKTIDPIAIAAHFIDDMQTVVSREKDPFETGVEAMSLAVLGVLAAK